MSIFDSLRSYIKGKDMNEQRQLTPAQVWGRGGIWQPLSGAGVGVSAESAMQAAMGACVRLLADDISSLPVDVIRKQDGYSQPGDAPPWLQYPTGKRWDTFQSYLSDVVVSMLTDGNVFIECVPDTSNPEYFLVRDPESINIERRGIGVIYTDGRNQWTDMQMAHIPWVRLPGRLRGISPLEAARESTGIEIAARQYEAAFYRNGATVGTVIGHPGKPTQDEVDLMRKSFNDRHQGSDKAFNLGIVTGGAKIMDGVVKPQEAALEALWKHTVEEAARFFHVPPHLLGSQESGAASYASVEQRSLEYTQHALLPITTRIEYAHGRFLRGQQLKVNVNALLRGDIKSRSDWYRTALMNKVMRPSEVRALEDLPYDPENTGYLQTPNNNVPDAYDEEEDDADDANAASINISDVILRDEAAAQLASKVTDAIASGQERAETDMAQMHMDILSKTELELNKTGLEVGELRAAVEALEAQRRAAMLPLDRHVVRDEEGRIVGTVEKQGDATIRKVIERDEAGRVVTIREVAA